jgi:hypothetical protein
MTEAPEDKIRTMKTTRYAWRLGNTTVKWNLGATTFWLTIGANTDTSSGHLIEMAELQNLIVLLEELAKASSDVGDTKETHRPNWALLP